MCPDDAYEERGRKVGFVPAEGKEGEDALAGKSPRCQVVARVLTALVSLETFLEAVFL